MSNIHHQVNTPQTVFLPDRKEDLHPTPAPRSDSLQELSESATPGIYQRCRGQGRGLGGPRPLVYQEELTTHTNSLIYQLCVFLPSQISDHNIYIPKLPAISYSGQDSVRGDRSLRLDIIPGTPRLSLPEWSLSLFAIGVDGTEVNDGNSV